MADKEIKSTLEMAMEKVARLPQLSPEEVHEQREREFGPRGRAIANRYFEGTLQHADLEGEVCRFKDDERDIVRKALKSNLCDAINLEDVDQSRRALEALQELDRGSGLEGKAGELEQLYTDHLRQREGALASFEESGGERLRQLGISGSAVRLNPDFSGELQQELQEIQGVFSSKLERLRRELL